MKTSLYSGSCFSRFISALAAVFSVSITMFARTPRLRAMQHTPEAAPTESMLSGEAEYNDNGTVTTIKAGDVTFTGDGEGHAITNYRDEPARFIALILYK